MKCSACSAERDTKQTKAGGDRLPRGWKRRFGSVYCDKCWANRYILRAVTMRVAGPTLGTWAELREALRAAWGEQTRLVNWMVDELYARDVRREPADEKLRPMPKIYLYPDARVRFPEVATATLAATEQQVKSKWSAKRYKVLWTNEEHLPRTKYPAPLPIPAANWSLEMTDDARRDLVVSARIGTQRMNLRLVGGHRYIRQRAALEKIASGEAVQCELSIFRKRAGGPDRGGKNGQVSSRQMIDRDEGGQHVLYDVMAKIVAWLPRPVNPRQKDGGIFYIKTDSQSLLVGLNVDEERLWIEHADHIRRIREAINAHSRNLQRWSDDQKAEQRPVPTFASRRLAAVDKQHRRMDSWVNEIVAHVVGYARRRRFASVVYDDTERGYIDSFPWNSLRTKIEIRCDEFGIGFTRRNKPASGEVCEENREPLAES